MNKLDSTLDKIMSIITNLIPVIPKNQQVIKQQVGEIIRFVYDDFEVKINQAKVDNSLEMQSQQINHNKYVKDILQINDDMKEIEDKYLTEQIIRNEQIVAHLDIEELLNNQPQSNKKVEDVLRLRKSDKERYRQQYETLKQRGQDKIHRLKDQILEYQTNQQATDLEVKKLKDILLSEQDIRFKLQETNEQQIKERQQLFNNDLLEIQMDLSGRIESLKNQVCESVGFQQEKLQMSDLIQHQQQIIQQLNQDWETHQVDFKTIMEQKNQKIEDLIKTQKKSYNKIQDHETEEKQLSIDKQKLIKQCVSILVFIKEVKQLREELLALVIQQQNKKQENHSVDARSRFSLDEGFINRVNSGQFRTSPEHNKGSNFLKILTQSTLSSPKGIIHNTQLQLLNSLNDNIYQPKNLQFLQGQKQKQMTSHENKRDIIDLEQAFRIKQRTSFFEHQSPAVHHRKYSEVSSSEAKKFIFQMSTQQSSIKTILANQIKDINKKFASSKNRAVQK